MIKADPVLLAAIEIYVGVKHNCKKIRNVRADASIIHQ